MAMVRMHMRSNMFSIYIYIYIYTIAMESFVQLTLILML
jgi:hypothetical protein